MPRLLRCIVSTVHAGSRKCSKSRHSRWHACCTPEAAANPRPSLHTRRSCAQQQRPPSHVAAGPRSWATWQQDRAHGPSRCKCGKIVWVAAFNLGRRGPHSAPANSYVEQEHDGSEEEQDGEPACCIERLSGEAVRHQAARRALRPGDICAVARRSQSASSGQELCGATHPLFRMCSRTVRLAIL